MKCGIFLVVLAVIIVSGIVAMVVRKRVSETCAGTQAQNGDARQRPACHNPPDIQICVSFHQGFTISPGSPKIW